MINVANTKISRKSKDLIDGYVFFFKNQSITSLDIYLIMSWWYFTDKCDQHFISCVDFLMNSGTPHVGPTVLNPICGLSRGLPLVRGLKFTLSSVLSTGGGLSPGVPLYHIFWTSPQGILLIAWIHITLVEIFEIFQDIFPYKIWAWFTLRHGLLFQLPLLEHLTNNYVTEPFTIIITNLTFHISLMNSL